MPVPPLYLGETVLWKYLWVFQDGPVNRPCSLYLPSKVLLHFKFILVLEHQKVPGKAVLVTVSMIRL